MPSFPKWNPAGLLSPFYPFLPVPHLLGFSTSPLGSGFHCWGYCFQEEWPWFMLRKKTQHLSDALSMSKWMPVAHCHVEKTLPDYSTLPREPSHTSNEKEENWGLSDTWFCICIPWPAGSTGCERRQKRDPHLSISVFLRPSSEPRRVGTQGIKRNGEIALSAAAWLAGSSLRWYVIYE
jgi:hypothetical protein